MGIVIVFDLLHILGPLQAAKIVFFSVFLLWLKSKPCESYRFLRKANSLPLMPFKSAQR
jgi:hypothetical protein